MFVTQEAVHAEIAYRLARAGANARVERVRGRRESPLRRWLTRVTSTRTRPPSRLTRPQGAAI